MGNGPSRQQRPRRRPHPYQHHCDDPSHPSHTSSTTRGFSQEHIDNNHEQQLPSTSAVAAAVRQQQAEVNSQGRPRTIIKRIRKRRPFGISNSEPETLPPRSNSNRELGESRSATSASRLAVALPALSSLPVVPVEMSLDTFDSVVTDHEQDEPMSSSQSDRSIAAPNQTFKLEMSINAADGSIGGIVFVDDRRDGGAGPVRGPFSRMETAQPPLEQVCSGCNKRIEESQADNHLDRSRPLRELLSNQELDDIYFVEGLQHLHKIYNDLATDVGNVICDETIGLLNERKQLKEKVFWQFKNPDVFTGIRQFRTTGIILYGEEGNGKTRMAKLITHHVSNETKYLNVHPYYLDSRDKYKRLVNIFRLASQLTPSVIVFESIDQIFGNNEILQELFVTEFRRCVEESKQVIIVATMNRCPHNLPLRIANCFEHKINIPMPRTYERMEFIQHFMKNVAHNLTKHDIKEIAKMTRFFTRSKMVALCRQAAGLSVSENIDLTAPRDSFLVRKVTRDDFVKVLTGNGIDAPIDPCKAARSSVSSNSTLLTDDDDDSSSNDTLTGDDVDDSDDMGMDEVD